MVTNMTVVYEESFDANEWFVIIILIVFHLLMWGTPRLFSLLEKTVHYLYGISVATFFDHTISVKPWDFYDVNDSSAYQIMDFLSYMMFGPFSYFFIYLYVKLNIKGFSHIKYVLSWTTLALSMEWIGVLLGLFHYDKGYKIYWSIPIYLLTLSVQLILYHCIRKRNDV
jgi:hypothetical protein